MYARNICTYKLTSICFLISTSLGTHLQLCTSISITIKFLAISKFTEFIDYSKIQHYMAMVIILYFCLIMRTNFHFVLGLAQGRLTLENLGGGGNLFQPGAPEISKFRGIYI